MRRGRLAPCLRPGVAGLQDRVVARALASVHGQIARDWNVDDLGREVGLSRSALADRFERVIGVPPIQYLAQWRMQVAAQRSWAVAQVGTARFVVCR